MQELDLVIHSYQKNMEKKLEFSYFFMGVNVNTYKAQCQFQGDYKFYLGSTVQSSLQENFIQPIEILGKEPFLLVTPGLKRNIYNSSKIHAISTFIEENLNRFSSLKVGVISFKNNFKTIETHHCYTLSNKGDLNEAAQHLFAAMRALDNSDVEIIITEKFPEEGLGKAINDRLNRASYKRA
jgi:hypothetical protein